MRGARTGREVRNDVWMTSLDLAIWKHRRHLPPPDPPFTAVSVSLIRNKRSFSRDRDITGLSVTVAMRNLESSADPEAGNLLSACRVW